MKDFYVYAHLNPDDNEIFYIGKGKGNRKNDRTKRNEKWMEYVSSLTEPFKVLVVEDKLTNDEALELEKKILNKVDAHYSDLTTNIADSEPFINDVGIVFSMDLSELDNSEEDKISKKPRFLGLDDSEIINSLLSFPNEKRFEGIEKSFEKIYNSFHDNYDELELIDEDIFMDIESVFDSIYELLQEYKVGEEGIMIDFVNDIEREMVDLEMIIEEEPLEEQKEIILNLSNWINQTIKDAKN